MLAILGVLVLSFAIFWEYKVQNVLWAEVIDIVAWVFLWETVDIKFFQTREMRMKRKRYGALFSMKIEYETL